MLALEVIVRGSSNFIGFPDICSKALLDAGFVVMLFLVLHLLGGLLEIGSRSVHFAASLFYYRISRGPKGSNTSTSLISSNSVHRLGVINDGLAVLNHGDPSPDECDVKALPFSRLAGQFRRSRQETVYATHVVTGRFLDGVGFDLNFIPAAHIDATVGILITLEFHMQFEIFELGIVDQFGSVPRTD